jgi:protease IV
LHVKLVRGVWKVLVAIKDGLVLVAMLLFFGLLFAALSATPNRAVVPGALVLKLDGPIVEQPSEVDPFSALSGELPREYRLRDVLRVLEAAKTDDRVKAVVLDLESFPGGYPATLIEVGQAIRAVRTAGKPVLAFATDYPDAPYMLAANASEVWVHPMGGVMPRGLGGNQLYFKGLMDQLAVNAHVYRVGSYKSAVEPFTRTDQSPEARQANQALIGAIFEAWKGELKVARPKLNVEAAYRDPAAYLRAAGGDAARASLRAGAVDRIGDRIAFGKRVAELAEVANETLPGSFKAIRYANYLAAHPVKTAGPAIGIVTVAGDIVDGEAPNGTAGGETISRAILKGLSEHDLKAIVVRVDSGGGSAYASEEIRNALLQAKARGLPIVISMGGVAASGGYWVATPGDVIFAEPTTITGSIGVFGVIPTFENSLAKIGITSDGVQSTPLSGQPDVFGGITPEADFMIQTGVEDIYRKFIGHVSAARKMPPARVNEIAQGRVWPGGTARQIGLVDRFGGMREAMAEAARRANVDPGEMRAVYLEKEPGWEAQFAAMFQPAEEDEDASRPQGMVGLVAAEQRATLTRALGDMRMLMRAQGVQARCLECGGLGPMAPARPEDASIYTMLLQALGR